MGQYASSPVIHHFITRQTPTWKKHDSRIEKYLDQALERSRKKMQDVGVESIMETGDNALDLMLARNRKERQGLTDSEMKQELLQCTSLAFFKR